MLEAAYKNGVSKYLWLSSTTGYPETESPAKEGQFFELDPPPPYEPVGLTSRFLEKLSELYVKKAKHAFSVIALQPTSIFGYGDDFNFESCHALPALIRRVIERRNPIEIWGSGEDGRDYLYVEDLVDACLLAVENTNGFEAFNIGSGKIHTLNQLLSIILELDSFNEATILRKLDQKRPVTVRQFDCEKAKNLLGFSTKTPVEVGLAKTLKWFRENQSLISDSKGRST